MKRTLLATLAFSATLCTTSFADDGEWISLFDGKSLAGWQANESPETWTFEDGAFKTQGPRSHLFYVGDVENHDFKNFEFYTEVKSMPGSNSGIYVHTKWQDEGWPAAGYELQVINSNPDAHGGYVEHKMSGSVYAVRNTWKAPVADGEWFEYRILVSGKTIRTFINDKLICEYTESESPWRPDDKKGRLLSSGTFAFQGHDPGSTVYFKNMKVRMLPDDAKSLSAPENDAELNALLTKFSNDNVPLIDIGIKAPSKSFQESLDYSARKYGMTFFNVSAPSDGSVAVITESEPAQIVAALKLAKEAGKKVVFDSQGANSVDVVKLKTRLKAIDASGLGWADFWVPGK